MEIYTLYVDVGIIVKLTISQLKLVSSEFGSAISKKTAFNLFLDHCRLLFFCTLSLEDPLMHFAMLEHLPLNLFGEEKGEKTKK